MNTRIKNKQFKKQQENESIETESIFKRIPRWLYANVPWTSLYGAAIGDICGSIYEFNNRKTDKPEEIELINQDCHFTDDTVLTASIADEVRRNQNYEDKAKLLSVIHRAVNESNRDYLLDCDSDDCTDASISTWLAQEKVSFRDLVRFFREEYCQKKSQLSNGYRDALWEWGNRYPYAGYGPMFVDWLASNEKKPYNSFGNGAAMRISPIAWMICERRRQNPANSGTYRQYLSDRYIGWLNQAVEDATVPTHNHPDGINGAHAVSFAIMFAWQGVPKDEIRQHMSCAFYKDHLKYNLNQSLDKIRPDYDFDMTCPGSVPVALVAFFESHDFVSAIQNAISVGGDSDTIAAIAGSIAEAYYRDIPEELKEFARSKLPEDIQVALGMIEK